jgi:type IV pilus biogenesis protein CpaD/CtpE
MQAPALALDRSLVINMRSAELSESQIEDFFITMAICNTVVVSNAVESGLVRGRGSEGVTSEKVMALRYEAESPDEAALVEVSHGYNTCTRTCTCTYKCTIP